MTEELCTKCHARPATVRCPFCARAVCGLCAVTSLTGQVYCRNCWTSLFVEYDDEEDDDDAG